MDRLRAFGKRLAERALVGSGLARRLIAAGRRNVAVLAYHNIVPRGERAAGERSLHMPQEAFADQLDVLCETHAVIDLDSLLQTRADHTEPAAVITFDDAYLGAMTAGLEELRKRDLGATVFVNPGCLETEGFWWDRLADPNSGILHPEIRDHALRALAGKQEAVVAWARTDGLALHPLPEHAWIAPMSCLDAAGRSGVVRYASHSWRHSRLPSLTTEELREDLRQTRDWLTERFASTSDWISYPYGDHSDTVARVASELHTGGLLIVGGTVRRPIPSVDRYRVPRINLPSGLSLDGFVLRLAGLR